MAGELDRDLRPNFEAACPKMGADGSDDMPHLGASFRTLTNARLDDTCRDAAPAGMQQGDGPTPGIDQPHRRAIRRQDSGRILRRVRDDTVGFDATSVAQRSGATIPQVALAWILANRTVTSVIIGAKKLPQLDDNLKAIDVVLSPDDKRALDAVSQLAPEYPAWMDALGSDRRPGEQRF